MSWFVYAFICALSFAAADTFSKKALSDNNSYFIAWVRVGFAAPLVLFILPFIEFPPLDKTFFIITFSLLPLDIIALILYMKAISISPLSLTLPFLSLTPIFLLGTAYVMLGEKPDGTGLIGIVLVAIGAYLLNIRAISHGVLEPIRAIFHEKGSMLMIIVAFIFSFTLNLGKMAAQHSDPLFFSVFYILLLSLSLFLLASFKTGNIISKSLSQPILFSLIGVSMAIMFVTHLKAVSLVEVSYMVSVKRLSLLFGVIIGAVYFKETNIKERFLGATVMVSGIVLISLF